MDFAGASFSGENLACVRGARVLFAGLSFHVKSGGVLLLTGPNGIGKSSLLRMMAGLLPPAAGRFRFTDAAQPDGDVPAPAYLGHADALKPLLTIRETIVFWTRLGGRAGIDHERTIADAIEGFGLGPIAHLPCRYLSAGQRRRTALARIAASGAPLWLLDEPTTALDTSGTDAFEQALDRHRRRGGCAVVATHGTIHADGAEQLEIQDFAGDRRADPGFCDMVSGGLGC